MNNKQILILVFCGTVLCCLCRCYSQKQQEQDIKTLLFNEASSVHESYYAFERLKQAMRNSSADALANDLADYISHPDQSIHAYARELLRIHVESGYRGVYTEKLIPAYLDMLKDGGFSYDITMTVAEYVKLYPEDTASRIFLFDWAMQNCRLNAIKKTDKHAEINRRMEDLKDAHAKLTTAWSILVKFGFIASGMSLTSLKQILGDPTEEDNITATWYAGSRMHVNPRFFAFVENGTVKWFKITRS